MKKHFSAALLPCLLLCVLPQHAWAGSMDKDLSDLLHEGDLGDAVPGLEKEGVTSFKRLLLLTDSDVDDMVQTQQLPMIVGRRLKKIASMRPGWWGIWVSMQSKDILDRLSMRRKLLGVLNRWTKLRFRLGDAAGLPEANGCCGGRRTCSREDCSCRRRPG